MDAVRRGCPEAEWPPWTRLPTSISASDSPTKAYLINTAILLIEWAAFTLFHKSIVVIISTRSLWTIRCSHTQNFTV
ncbi:hypothetical protein PtrSN002B_007452 [Pyrenophora tritici-repentis]|uniref:Uncharacterized protein n=1 Tax=Pyrenophora tritici-repentis TaxID=45151 RepID=A0A2W1DQK6_9PLEO|nr:hypothetical protein PtrV1_03101 [Pyrenophora tritici-repentis]KAF7579081.1 hypothetical protein PtrM4_033210 [Pyrenophora tritici-repentis]KAI0569953.1 hypothetical protein Alg130_11418 [Pyrenophora tritici-repentis]KAI0574866.1 hypothetical protein Alg215_08355 [Pyrenophora tritici-repentis]KAI0604386.1 hypothetical protein TUN205_11366 [Pyrenophora tritici-repentis]